MTSLNLAGNNIDESVLKVVVMGYEGDMSDDIDISKFPRPASKPKKCGECGKKIEDKDEIYTVGYGRRKKKVCGGCFDDRYTTG